MSVSSHMCNDGSMTNERKEEEKKNISTAKIEIVPKLKKVNQSISYYYFRQEKKKNIIFAQTCKVNPEIGSEHYRELNPRRSLQKIILKRLNTNFKKKLKNKKKIIGKIKKTQTHQPRNANATGRTRAWKPTPAFRL